MGFVAPIVSGVTGLISAISARKNAKAAGQQNALMQQAQGQQMGALQQGQQAGNSMLQMGLPATQNALNYFGTLLRGGRAAMAQATAGPRAALTDEYRGAQVGLEHAGVRGGERATALAELNRDRVAKIAGLTTGVQPMAAQQVGSMGMGLTSGGTSALLNAASGYGGLAGQASGVAQQHSQDERADLAGVGKSVGEVLKWWKDRKAGQSGGSLPGGGSWTPIDPTYSGATYP